MKKIQRVVRDIPQHWVGDGFPVPSLFSYNEAETFDPFLLLDYAEPYEFASADQPRGVGTHPHRGFETVTIVYQGELAHRDSSGNSGKIGPGDVQWMTAASGVLHEEFHSEQFTKSGGMFEVAQLWVNLPASEKMSPPRYQEILTAQIPDAALPNKAGTARVIAGELLGTHGPAKTVTPINVWELKLNAKAQLVLPIPAGHTTIVIAQTGAAQVGERPLKAVELALLSREGDSVSIASDNDARLLVLTGQPLGEPVAAQGPFVMNTPEQIREAMEDFRAGRMGKL